MNIKNKDIILSIFILIFIIITSFFIGYSWNNIVVKKDKKDNNLKIEHLDDNNTKNNSNEPNVDNSNSEIESKDSNVVDENVGELTTESKIDISNDIEEQSNDDIAFNKVSEEKKINSIDKVEPIVKTSSNYEEPIANKEEKIQNNNGNCKCNVTCPSKDDKDLITNTNNASNKNKQTAKNKQKSLSEINKNGTSGKNLGRVIYCLPCVYRRRRKRNAHCAHG